MWVRGPDAGRRSRPQEQNGCEDGTSTVASLQTQETAGRRGPSVAVRAGEEREGRSRGGPPAAPRPASGCAAAPSLVQRGRLGHSARLQPRPSHTSYLAAEGSTPDRRPEGGGGLPAPCVPCSSLGPPAAAVCTCAGGGALCTNTCALHGPRSLSCGRGGISSSRNPGRRARG